MRTERTNAEPATKLPVGYIVSTWPRLSTTFILNEVIAVEQSGVQLQIYSLKNPDGEPVHAQLGRVRARVTYLSLRGHWRPVLQAHLRVLRRKPRRYCRALARALWCRRRIALRAFLQAGYLTQELFRNPVAHIHAHFAHTPTLVAMFTHELTGIPYTFTAHAKDIYVETTPRILRAEAQRAEAVVTCSNYNVQYLSTQIGQTNSGKFHCIYNGLDLSRFQFRFPQVCAPEPPLILSVARLVEKKGLGDLIMAADILRQRGRSFRVEIIGHGTLQRSLEAQIMQLGLSDRVTLKGAQTQDSVCLAYQRATVFALPCVVTDDGDRDGMPTVLLEAMASGIPVVSTPVTGIPEAIEADREGLLVPPNNPGVLADAIDRLLAQPALRERLARAARSKIEARFSIDRTCEQLLTLFQRKGPTINDGHQGALLA